MATMKQIAELAGVSRGTVDRVLNNRGEVNQETAKRILDIAKSLNYVPNKTAKLLSVRKADLKLAYILFDPKKNVFFSQVEAGIKSKASELADYGVDVETVYSDFSDQDRQNVIVDDLINKGVQGIAICGFDTENARQKIREITDKGIPVVTANSDILGSGRLAYVGSHYIKGGRTAAYLAKQISNGKATVGVLLGSYNILCHSERLRGFLDFCKTEAPGISIPYIAENTDDEFQSFALTNEMLSSNPDIDTIFLASAGVYGACRAVELLPPDRRPKVICFDSVPTTVEMLKNDSISFAICQQPEKQGSKPLELLFNYIAMGIKPEEEYYYTDIDILIKENLPGNV